eukprot:4154058-Pleurochrysis_carterae.AAC.3
MASEVNYGYRRPMVDMKHEKAMLLIGGKTPPEILRERIESSASVVPDSETGAPMLKVSSFINHQVDCHLMSICGQHLAYRSRGRFGTSKILATKTGALLAQSCALHMRLPLVVALDQPPVGANGCKVYENGGNYISSEFLTSEDRVLVLDLFLSSGIDSLAIATDHFNGPSVEWLIRARSAIHASRQTGLLWPYIAAHYCVHSFLLIFELLRTLGL